MGSDSELSQVQRYGSGIEREFVPGPVIHDPDIVFGQAVTRYSICCMHAYVYNVCVCVCVYVCLCVCGCVYVCVGVFMCA